MQHEKRPKSGNRRAEFFAYEIHSWSVFHYHHVQQQQSAYLCGYCLYQYEAGNTNTYTVTVDTGGRILNYQCQAVLKVCFLLFGGHLFW